MGRSLLLKNKSMSNLQESQAQTINEQAINALNSRLPKGFKVVGNVENHSVRLLVSCTMELQDWITLCEAVCHVNSTHLAHLKIAETRHENLSRFNVFSRFGTDLIMVNALALNSIRKGELS